MPRVIQKRQFGLNRKKIFEVGDLRMWLDTDGSRPVKGAVLELKRLRPRTKSKWDLVWSGVVRIEEWGALVENKKLGDRPQK